MVPLSRLLTALRDVADPRRAQGKRYPLPHLLLFTVLALMSGARSYRGIITFLDERRDVLNQHFGVALKRAPAVNTLRTVLQSLDGEALERAFRHHARDLLSTVAADGRPVIALDGKTLRGSFDHFNDRAAAQVLSAFATDTALVLAHVDIAEKSNEIPAAQTLLAQLGVADGSIVTLDALHCQKNISRSRRKPTSH